MKQKASQTKRAKNKTIKIKSNQIRLSQNKKRFLRSRLKLCLSEFYQFASSRSVSQQQSSYFIAKFFAKLYEEAHGYENLNSFLSGLCLINSVAYSFTQIECYLLGCVIFGIVSKMFHNQRSHVLGSIAQRSPFTTRQLAQAEKEFLLYIKFNIPMKVYQQYKLMIKKINELEIKMINKFMQYSKENAKISPNLSNSLDKN